MVCENDGVSAPIHSASPEGQGGLGMASIKPKSLYHGHDTWERIRLPQNG